MLELLSEELLDKLELLDELELLLDELLDELELPDKLLGHPLRNCLMILYHRLMRTGDVKH